MDDLWITKSEDVGLTVRTISFQHFQPVWSHDPTTLQTDRQTTCDLKTGLCTIVRQAVKSAKMIYAKINLQMKAVIFMYVQ